MSLTLRTSVNRWECDENDHMNVRFFLQKHWEALSAGLPENDLSTRVRSHHIRFHREARIATPISGYLSAVALDSGRLCHLTELKQSFTQETMSTCLHELDGIGAVEQAELPSSAAPRGVQNRTSEFAQLGYGQLQQRGFALIGAGKIDSSECDLDGRLQPFRYMGRLSDSMPHLWGAIHQNGVLDDNEGGAVLEYRLEYFAGLTDGDRYEIWSGLRDVGEKVQEFVHLVFNQARELAMVAEAAGVRLDLIARKAKVLSPEVVKQMQTRTLDRTGIEQDCS